MLRDAPSGWGQITLGDAAEINPASLPSSTRGDFEFRYIDVATVAGPSILLEPRRLRFAEAPSRARRMVADGDILVSTVRPYLRSFCRVRDSRTDLVASTGFAVVRPREGVDGEFLYQHVLAAWFTEHLIPRMKGSNYPAVSPQDVAEYSLRLPPLPEQRRIAEILSSVDEAIQTTQAVIKQTHKVEEGVLERLLTKGIGQTRFKQTEIGEIPEGWKVRPLEDIAVIERGRFSVRPRNDPRYFGGSVPFVQTGDIVAADGLLTCHWQTLNDGGLSVSKLFRTGTILITIAANIGNTAITTYPVCCPDSVVGIQPAEGIDVDWLRAFMVTKQADLDRQATRNAQKNINLQNLRPLLVKVPSLEEQAEIGLRIRDMASSLRALSAESTGLAALKSALMADLLTGRRRVTDNLLLAAE